MTNPVGQLRGGSPSRPAMVQREAVAQVIRSAVMAGIEAEADYWGSTRGEQIVDRIVQRAMDSLSLIPGRIEVVP